MSDHQVGDRFFQISQFVSELVVTVDEPIQPLLIQQHGGVVGIHELTDLFLAGIGQTLRVQAVRSCSDFFRPPVSDRLLPALLHIAEDGGIARSHLAD